MPCTGFDKAFVQDCARVSDVGDFGRNLKEKMVFRAEHDYVSEHPSWTLATGKKSTALVLGNPQDMRKKSKRTRQAQRLHVHRGVPAQTFNPFGN